MRYVIVPYVPAVTEHTITGCRDCPNYHFSTEGGYDECCHKDLNLPAVSGDDIPSFCPIAKTGNEPLPASSHKIVFTYGGPNPYIPEKKALVVLEQDSDLRFRLSYGLQITSNMTYVQACRHLGEALLHHLSCESVVNNQGV